MTEPPMTPATMADSSLLEALMQPDFYDHPVDQIRLIETHISWVILTGDYAYKLKKPVDLGFLDFSSLQKRRFYCEEEVRLNRRLAPHIYLDVVPIYGTPQKPNWTGAGDAIEYAVKMVEFPQQAQMDRLLAREELKPAHLDAFARLIATFHQEIDRASSDEGYGDPEYLYQPVKENFSQIREYISDQPSLQKIDELKAWIDTRFTDLKSLFERRKAEGYIRECHGDIHLRNMAWLDEKPLVFDCIEFDPNLRWIDVISEIAFLVMDLQERKQFSLAQGFLNSYLERTGDYGGVRLLLFYLMYRALVRAKVEAIRAGQFAAGSKEQVAADQAFREYLQLAESYTLERRPQLIITRGFSASGKTTVTRQLLERLGAIRIRSDVERKRLFGMQAKDSGQAAIGQEIYSAEASRRTYDELAELAGQVLEGNFPVIIDSASLQAKQRMRFQALAAARQVPYLILDITASESTLRQRIEQREKGASDADLAVLEHQLKTAQGLKPAEAPHVIRVNTEGVLDIGGLLEQIKSAVSPQ